jgi:hypothetical protein
VSKGVDVDGDALMRVHPADLSLFEISGNPDVIAWYGREQFLAGLHSLSDFDGLLADNAIQRGEIFV